MLAFLRVIAAAAVMCAHSATFIACAQTYPVKPIRIVVGFTPGGVATSVARLLGSKLSESLGQNVIIENRGGASGAIANEMVAKSPPDGYTLLIVGATAAVLPSLRNNLPYDLERDLTAISLVSNAPFVLVVHPSVPARSAGELIALARARPGKVSFGSVGVGSTPHLMAELFRMMAKLDIMHVPYKGGSENAVANASGQVEMSFLSAPSLQPLIGGNRVRALAVSSAKRVSFLPGLPALSESLPGYDYANWNGVTAPAALPKDIVARLNAVIVKMAAAPDVKELFNQQGMEPLSSTPEQFAAFLRNEVAKNAKLVQAIGIKAE